MHQEYVAVLTTKKTLLMFGLGAFSLFTSEIGDPQIEKYVQLGIGGVLSAVIFYFYRQQAATLAERERENAELLAKRERENADAYKIQAALLIATLQETSRVNTQLSTAVSELRTQLAELTKDQRDRYEQELRDGGRRRYDPPAVRTDGGT
jgi:shikimate 5-dehydrogenase